MKKCLDYEECIAITLVKPNPEFYDSTLHGCHLKSGKLPWQARTTRKEANMVSVNVVCVRGKSSFSNNHDIILVLIMFILF